MDDDASSAKIYLLDEDERQVSPDGPVVIGPDGARQELPPLVFQAIEHVIAAMRTGYAVKISPLRHELPIDEAAFAIGMAKDDLRAYVAEGAVPFRSTQYVDWVRLADVMEWDRQRREQLRAGVQAMLDEGPWEESEDDGSKA